MAGEIGGPRAGRQRRRWRAQGVVVPRLWLVTDAARLPDPREAARRLPKGSAVLARDLAPEVLAATARLCRARGLRLVVSGDGRAALALRAGLHVPDRRPCAGLLPYLLARRRRARWALLSAAVHGRVGVTRAARVGADAALVSPAFPTASHPGAAALGSLRWSALARLAARRGPVVIALGGVTARLARRLPGRTTAGWAALEGLWPPRHSVSPMSRASESSACRPARR